MISILLATYNGEKYITQQVESILSQTNQDFRLFIYDDKSTDKTFSILTEYASKFPEKITVVQNDVNTGGTKLNFMQMMVRHKDDYVMLCDQDDVWLPDKIEVSLSKIKEMEKKSGSDTPLLVHTDLKVVDDNLDVISSSYEKMSNKDFSETSVNFAVTMNNVAGCTALYNKALAGYFTAVPGFFVMHDWWLSLTAAVFGKIGAVNKQPILYRQHRGNEKGAKRVISAKYFFYVMTHVKTMTAMINDSYKQAGAFLETYGSKINAENLELISAYASIPVLPKFKRLGIVRKYKTYMYGKARKVAQLFFLLTASKNETGIFG
ncbi:MAG: glycosyltransferase family 2 protein [Oscillospiraceae bacterium]|nr:glycosyltransferase family 2 protein [Oscillospiraceae bacterium]